MALSNFISLESPYVHSHSENFQAISSFNQSSVINERKVEESIKALRKISNDLQSATNSFLEGKPWQQLSKEIFNQPNTFRDVARRVIINPEMLDALVPTVKKENIIQNRNFTDQVTNAISKDGDTLSALSRKIVEGCLANYFSTSNKKRTLEEQIEGIAEALKTEKDQVKKAFEDTKVKKSLRSKNGKVLKVVKNVIASTYVQNLENSTARALKTFEKLFREELKKEDIIITSNGGEDSVKAYLNRVNLLFEEEMKKRKTEILSDKNTAKGILGEEFNMAIVNADIGFGYEFQVIGLQTENEVRERYFEEISNIPNDIPNLVKDPTKEGYSDLYLINPSGKRVRVQSKNTWEALQVHMNDQDKEFVTAGMEVLKDQPYIKFVKTLQQSRTSLPLSDAELGLLSYYIANAIWFKNHKDQSVTNSSSVPDMSTAVSLTESILTKGLSNYLGVIFDKEHDYKVFSEFSNLFFIVGNIGLIPTYVIVDEIIKGLEVIYKKSTEIKFHFGNTVKIKGLKDSGTFWKEKDDTIKNNNLPRLKSGFFDYDDRIVQIGQKQGEAIIGGLTVKRVNLNISLIDLLKTTSYVFKT